MAVIIALFCIRRKSLKQGVNQGMTQPFIDDNYFQTTYPIGSFSSHTGDAAGTGFRSEQSQPVPGSPLATISSSYPRPPRSNTSMNSISRRPSHFAAESAGAFPLVPTRTSEPSSPLRTIGRDVRLSDGQVDLLNDLYRRNIPASAIARIMERMLQGGDEGAGSEVGSDYQPPPSYDYKS